MNEAAYRELIQKLRAIEEQHKGSYLADEGVDYENVIRTESFDKEGNVTIIEDERHPEFWNRMHSAALDAAQFRAEDDGIDLSQYGIEV